ncbi:MarR family transcriptional regulator [Microlunatus elymi]|uniref:MarR family transcriptional regulator n=1 Tax=Microlunatus elymi TaxID=2596828 RepID=A0A516PX77_9ACTN|nr:MarR family transcriptional regulator [Microlunatus elymi]QDP95777.1 MarR family transcriptional regulator [Microlunatus elymi]
MVERANGTDADTEDRIAYQTRRLQQLLRRTGDATLQTIGLTLAQFTVLKIIGRSQDASSAQIARECNVSRQSLQDLIRTLRDRGYIQIAEQSRGGRSLPIRITPQGRTVLRKADRAMSRIEDRMVAGISERDVDRTVELLRRCAENLDAV